MSMIIKGYKVDLKKALTEYGNSLKISELTEMVINGTIDTGVFK